jgi:hypothetical protein
MAHRRTLALCWLLVCTAVGVGETDPRKEAELKWAKEVATDFLNAGVQSHYQNAETLLTADYRKALKEGHVSLAVQFRDLILDGKAEFWSINVAEMAPDKDEALFRGATRGKKGGATFALRVVKEKEGGKWRVAFFATGTSAEAGEKPKE